MARGACALALLCAVVAGAVAYTVDCNHEYTDCDTELSKLNGEDEDVASSLTSILPDVEATSTTPIPTRSTPNSEESHINKTEVQITTEVNEVTEAAAKPKPRLLNLNVDELQNFANVLHNQTKGIKKTIDDLSDVNLDEDEDESPRDYGIDSKNKQIPEKFYSNLQKPFNPLLSSDKSEEIEICKEGGVTYKIGEHIDRGCEETCECTPSGVFECSPRCKHPFIRRGRRLNDPLCFESPVDDCCSIVACVNSNGEPKPPTEVCRYGNDTYPVGESWHIGCEQTCSCERNSVVTCRPRCKPLPQSDVCINVQDPTDECCDMQICDVSHDAHEEQDNSTSTSTTTTTEVPKKSESISIPERPLVLAEPIGSIKVLQNNTVQVNLMHVNNSEDPIHLLLSSDGGNTFHDIELKYSNLIFNLEGGKDYVIKTKETGTKFNFTVTATDAGNEVPVEEGSNEKIGCYHDGQFYNVGDEFHIGCKELCECTGADTRDCAPLQCPTHVGLELVSRGCVQWAPSPPAKPPNCCPRVARCLSDGTCHYKGVAVPNWSEVPISLTGCEQHCFCENGELDCQDACAPLPALPPHHLRCAPHARPAPVNASDDDCCKVWGCVPNAGNMNITYQTHTPTRSQTVNYVTPITPAPSNINTFLPTPPTTTKITEFYGRFAPIKTGLPKYFKTLIMNDTSKNENMFPKHYMGDNITVFTPEDIEAPYKIIHPEPPFVVNSMENSEMSTNIATPPSSNSFINTYMNAYIPNHDIRLQGHKPFNIIMSDDKLPHIVGQPLYSKDSKLTALNTYEAFVKQMNDDTSVKKMPLPQYNNIHYFSPFVNKADLPLQNYFEPAFVFNKTKSSPPYNNLHHQIIHNIPTKHIAVVKNKDLKAKPTDLKTVWAKNYQTQLLVKEPNPYETVLLKAIPKIEKDEKLIYSPLSIPRVPSRTYSSLDLEHLLNQMELESDTNKNLGRSADKSHGTITAGQMPPGIPNIPPQTPPPFLPTVPTNDRYPEESDYEQNNIHRPMSALEPIPGLPPGLPIPNYGVNDDNKKLQVLSLQADSPTSVKMLFGLPPVLVGLRGSVDLRYTDTADEDITQWYSQVFAPADEILTTPRLEFRLTGLKPSTTYKIRGKLYLHNLPVEPESEIYTVRTQDTPTVLPPEEKRKKIDSKLTVVEVNDTTAYLSWRHFTEDELQYIDSIQVRYRPTGTPIYSTTELLHHSRGGALLTELRAHTRYEAALVLAPPPRARSELYDPQRVEFTTTPYVDPYNFTITISVVSIGATAVQLSWSGPPSPAERWVRVYRAAHSCRGPETDTFKLADRDSTNNITLTGLEPDSKCRVWLELFLTNGKVKTSNVLDIHTKSADSDEPIDNTIEASSAGSVRRGGVGASGDYYSALVVTGALAALAALAAALLLLVVVRRHRPRSVAITTVPSAPRESSLPPYDNPAYKLELQQETMNL